MRRLHLASSMLVITVLCFSLVRAQDIPPPPPGEELGPAPAARNAGLGNSDDNDAFSDDFDVQTRGPIHEAFAEQVQANPEPGLLINKRPPNSIEELPPNIKPEGPDVIWIPGYWAWDDENEDFLWISGIWRRPPPGQQWAPGYWAEVDGGYRWVSGFWAPEGQNIVYREPPPESRDQQIILEGGADNQFWIPGTWQWQNDQYAWTNGYYAPCQDNWVWIPARWRWTPRGAVYLNGYWDFRPTVRAMLFAPVVFRPGVLLRPRFHFTPRVVVDPWNALNHFWVRPQYCHYYFGNYYGPNYGRRGFQSYSNYYASAGHWDPIFTYYQSHYRRQGVDFHARLNSWNTYYTKHADLRPPMNWQAQQNFAREHRGSDILRSTLVTSSMNDFVNASGRARMPLVSIDDQVRLSLGQADSRMTKQLLAHRELAERTKRDAAAAGKASDLGDWSMPKIQRDLGANDLRMAGKPLHNAIRADLDGKVTTRKMADIPREPKNPTRTNSPNFGDSQTNATPKKDALKADMDLIRERFGNDPVRFQQEMDRLMSRRYGESPSITPRIKPLTPDADANNAAQGSGRTGGLGSPDFRLLPRGSGGNPKSNSKESPPPQDGAGDRQPFSFQSPPNKSMRTKSPPNNSLANQSQPNKLLSNQLPPNKLPTLAQPTNGVGSEIGLKQNAGHQVRREPAALRVPPAKTLTPNFGAGNGANLGRVTPFQGNLGGDSGQPRNSGRTNPGANRGNSGPESGIGKIESSGRREGARGPKK